MPPPHSPPQHWLRRAWQAFDGWFFGSQAPAGEPTRGQQAEDIAARYLEAKGYAILERNWRCKWGELDLVARRDECLVFVEVKSSREDEGYHAATRVGPRKQRQIARLAEMYVKQRQWAGHPVQADVVEVTFPEADQPRIRHFEHAFGDVRRR